MTTIRDLGPAELSSLIYQASALRDEIDRGARVERSLVGRSVANLFFEPSTRTRLSFDLAAQRLGADVVTFSPETSSTSKGESLRDTVLTVAAMGVDFMVVRHAEDGVPQRVADWTGVPVINAGDGMSEHPTQALLDAVTIQRHFGKLAGLRLGLVGDIAHSRVAGSLIHALPVLGVDVTLIGPGEWVPANTGLATSDGLDPLLGDLDIVYLLRVQTERGGVVSEDYVSRFQMDRRRSSRLNENAIVMHPGPLNRGVEVEDSVADSPRSRIIEQVRNGVPTRMAVLRALGAGAE
ncbi:MAG: aspartate carbamoyltransferase catalytic subunit [Acidimicrobiia bacterium]